jgi:hypothetical protein
VRRSKLPTCLHRVEISTKGNGFLIMRRRDFISGATSLAAYAASGDLTTLPVTFGPCPRTTEEFLKYIVQRRAAEGLNAIILSDRDPRYLARGKKNLQVGTVYGGSGEDSNLAWVAASAYRYPWSRFHQSEVLRNRAFVLLDGIVRIHGNGKWDDGGLAGITAPHNFGWAILSWLETGDVDAPRAAAWRDAFSKTADDALVCLHYGPYRPSALTGQYANPELHLVSGLAAAWKATGNSLYRDEAARALRRYDEWLFPGGGLPYFLGSSPQHGYQAIAVQSVALYYDLTQDPYAGGFLKRLAPYFPNVQHRSGLLTDAEQPWQKHDFFNMINPGAPAILALTTGDGANRAVADVATVLTADILDQRAPSFARNGFNWYNYESTTYAAAALRLMERVRLPSGTPQPARRIFMDESFRGPRSHWDDFTAAVGTRQMNDSMAGAYLADSGEPVIPLGAAVDGVYFEVLQGKTEFRCVDWTPTVSSVAAPGFSSVSCLTRLCAPYWGDMPYMPGEHVSAEATQVSDWYSLQHWAVWRDHLIGFGTLRFQGACEPSAQQIARVRWRLSPHGRTLRTIELSPLSLRFQFGGLRADLACLDQSGGFSFQPEQITEAPRESWTPLLVRPAQRASGAFAHVATIVRPANTDGVAAVRSLPNGAAAVLLEPGQRKASVWVVNLHRQMQQYMLVLPKGVKVTTYKHNAEMPPVPSVEPANAGLVGGEGAVWVIESDSTLDAQALLSSVSAGKSR